MPLEEAVQNHKEKSKNLPFPKLGFEKYRPSMSYKEVGTHLCKLA